MDRKLEKTKRTVTKVSILVNIILFIMIAVYLLFYMPGVKKPGEKAAEKHVPAVVKEAGDAGTGSTYSWGIQPITIGESLRINSKILSEEREIRVYLPEDYETSQAKYHVLYLLDGRRNFLFASGIARYLSIFSYTPRLIVVAILNKNVYDRNRNFTPTIVAMEKGSGGARNFLDFIKEELIPYIDTKYKTYPYRVLAGHSFGGLFTIYSMLSEPHLFNGYIAVSPSLWYDNDVLIKIANRFFSVRKELNCNMFITMSREGDLMLSSLKKFEQVVKGTMPKGFRFHIRLLMDEDRDNHQTTAPRSMALALLFMYKNWQLPDEIIETGLASMKTHLVKLSQKLGYNIVIPEYLANRIGYDYLYAKEYKKAVNMFRYNVMTFPDSANVYDSLGEAYMLDKQYDLAKENYAKVLEIEPGNRQAKKMLKILAGKVK